MIYLLDTNAVSDLMNEHPRFLAKLATIPDTDLTAICPIIRGEILHGIERLPAGRRRSILVDKATKVFNRLSCEPLGEAAGDSYARIRHDCESRGVSLHENDLWIAASAFEIGAVLITRDIDLSRVAGIRIEDWTS